MGQRDIKSTIDVVQLFTKIQRTATATIVGTDVTRYRGAAFYVDIGAWTADGLTVTFQHRDASDAWADIPNSDLDGSANNIAIVTGLANTVIKVGYTGNKEDIGAVITDAANGDAVVGVSVVKGFPNQFPT